MSWQADQAYNELPPLPPSLQLIETIPVLKACISARAALAELKQAGELLPNQDLLINLLPLLEAKDSSEIENIVTTMDKLFQFAQEDSAADAATSILQRCWRSAAFSASDRSAAGSNHASNEGQVRESVNLSPVTHQRQR